MESQKPEFKKLSCIIEVIEKTNNGNANGNANGNSNGNANGEWILFNQYCKIKTLFMCEDIRLSANARILIDQMWEYIKSKNQLLF